MQNYKIKTSFVNPETPKAPADKTGINFMIFILFIIENWKIIDISGRALSFKRKEAAHR